MLSLAVAVVVLAPQSATSSEQEAVTTSRSEGIPVAQLTPMDESDVRKLANGCLDEGPYPADAGPLCFFPDGRAIRYGGWGNTVGRYEVVKNKVVIINHNYVTDNDLKPYSLSFYHDEDGRPYYRYDRSDLPAVADPLRMQKKQ